MMRLEAAEREAQELRRKLEGSRDGTGEELDAEEVVRPLRRVDGKTRRETFFVPRDSGAIGSSSWLSEADVGSFFTGKAPSELMTGGSALTEEEKGEVRRRALLGIGLTAATGALSLIPTENLDVFSQSTKQPEFFYVTSIVQSYEQLAMLEDAVTYGRWDEMQRYTKRILDEPGYLKANMLAVIKLTKDPATADKMRKHRSDSIDFLGQVDYNEYFNTLLKPTGKQEIEFTQFSLDSLAAARKSMQAFLDLVPRDDLEAARSQVEARSGVN